MLGYTLEDLQKMIGSISMFAESSVFDKDIQEGILMSLDFLQGLWAEGYFD